MTSRPDRLVVVAGTGTEVGKTWCAARIIEHLRAAGVTVGARKPAQSFDPDDPYPTDAAVLAGATGEAEDDVCAPDQCYPVPLAPPMAATALDRPPIFLADLVAASSSWPTPAPEIGFVELAGGVRSPLANEGDGDGVALTAALAPDSVLLVADAGLGTINSVRLSVEALASGCRVPIVVLLNRYDPADDLHERNRAWLAHQDGLDVVTTPADAAGRLRVLRPADPLRPDHP
ncbi:MAG: dethiobiotin synthase [Acidimicrobiales bacterium]|nr:dethiobiotin synthase [Acidimicrobiales bacterium]